MVRKEPTKEGMVQREEEGRKIEIKHEKNDGWIKVRKRRKAEIKEPEGYRDGSRGKKRKKQD